MKLLQLIFTNEQKKLGKNLKLLLLIHSLFILALALSNIFLNIFIWKLSKNFYTVIQYNLVGYITLPLTFIFGGLISKKLGLRTNLISGMILYSLFFLFILFIKENIIQYVLLIGALKGIASGFYYGSFNVLGYDFSNDNNRDYFFGVLGLITSTLNMIAPLIAGYTITYSQGNKGYAIIFITSFMFLLFGLIMSFSLDNNFTKSKYYLSHAINLSFRNPNLARVMFAETFRGLRDEKIVSMLINILLFIIVQKESTIGNYSFWTFLVGLISCYLAGILLNPKNRIKYMLAAALAIMFISSIVLFGVNAAIFWIFGITDSIVIYFVRIPHNANSFAVISSLAESKKLRIETIIVKELYLNVGRIFSLLVLAIVNTSNELILLFLFILGLSQFGIWLLHRKVNINNIKTQITQPSVVNQKNS